MERDEFLITKTPILPYQVEHPHKDLEPVYDYKEKLPVPPIELSFWENLTSKVKNAYELTKLGISITPSLLSLTWAITMKNSTKIATAAVALLVAILGHVGILIPEGLVAALDVLVAALLGWLIPAPGQSKSQ